MSALPDFHLTIMQPAGYVHSLGFVDQARYLRHQFRRHGARVTIAKNRVREDAINIVFGAHLGFPNEWKRRHTCLFFNLEQLGQMGAKVRPEYLALLRSSAVIDYDPGNVAAYCSDPLDVPLVPFLHAPYLFDATVPALESRPIDLLFFGSMNERRRRFIAQVEESGVQVSMFDHPIYGPERDSMIVQAKAVLNCSYYETSRFEQVRVSHCLSLGTPVISERHPNSQPSEAFEDAVFWLPQDDPAKFFRETFAQPSFYAHARAKLADFARHDPAEAYADLMAFCLGVHQGSQPYRSAEPWRPAFINLGSGKDYKPGWLNIDVLDRAEPDVVLDLAGAVEFPVCGVTRFGSPLELAAGSIERIYANNVLEHVPDLPGLMTNALILLREGGVFEIEVPYERALTAWQDPTHVRAMNENSWLYYTDWFWYLGWFTHRFDLSQLTWLDTKLKPCDKANAAFMKVALTKRPTTLHERTIARARSADFGGIADDFACSDDAEPEPADDTTQAVVHAAPARSLLPAL